MKKIRLFLSFAIVALLIVACSKIDLIDMDLDENAPNDGVLKILVSGNFGDDHKSSAAVAANDTIKIEGGNTYNFSYQSSLEMTTVQWTFSNNGNTSQERLASNRYERAFTISKVTLVGVDQSGQSHSAVIWLNNLPRANGDPVLYKGKQLLSGNLYRHEFWLYKNGAYVAPLPYLFKGNVTSPPWTNLVTIPAADTNYRMSGNQLYTMPSGQTGHWVRVYIDSPTNFMAELAPLVRITQDVGEQWASFKGSLFVNSSNYGLIKYYVNSNGDVVPEGGTSNAMPGQGGDGIIRFEDSGSNLIIFQKNESDALNPWIQFSHNDSWSTPVYTSTPLTLFPTWSKYTIAKSELPVRAQFGGNINTMVVNTNISSSSFYDAVYGGLYIAVAGL